jgi:enoyl-CoA hydratase/carnithine racemase
MSPADRVTLERVGAVAVVSLNRPEKLNGLDLALLDGLLGVARRLRRDRTVRTVILRGEGPAFSSGLDFGSVGRQPVRMLMSFIPVPGRGTNRFQEVVWAWRRLPMPVIAVLHGRCYGGGIQIALGADFRIATPDCELSVMEAKWGLVPDMTGSVTLSELVGLDVAKRLVMTGEILSGEAAQRIGLVTEISEDPLDRAFKLSEQLVARSPDAVAASKRLLNRSWHARPHTAFALERRLQARLIRGVNHRIARTAAMAREAPRYVDRVRRG